MTEKSCGNCGRPIKETWGDDKCTGLFQLRWGLYLPANWVNIMIGGQAWRHPAVVGIAGGRSRRRGGTTNALAVPVTLGACTCRVNIMMVAKHGGTRSCGHCGRPIKETWGDDKMHWLFQLCRGLHLPGQHSG